MDILDGVECSCGTSAVKCAKICCCICMNVHVLCQPPSRRGCFPCLGKICIVCGSSKILSCICCSLRRGRRRCSFAVLLYLFLSLYSVAFSFSELFLGFQLETTHCDIRVAVHLVIQGFGYINLACLFLRISVRYYLKVAASQDHLPVALRFWKELKSDSWMVGMIVLAVMSFVWALVGLHWLSVLTCDQRLTASVFDKISCINLIIVLIVVTTINVMLGILQHCNDGACSRQTCGPVCFLCCCFLCVRTKNSDFANRVRNSLMKSRSLYSQPHNDCLLRAIKVAANMGFLVEEQPQQFYAPAASESAVIEGENHMSQTVQEAVLPCTVSVCPIVDPEVMTLKKPIALK